MKRWISAALIGILAWTSVLGGLAPAFAEEEAVSENVEIEAAPAAETGAEGLVVELESLETEAEAEDEPAGEAVTEAAPTARYARVSSSARVYAQAGDELPFALVKGGTVLLTGETAEGRASVAFHTERGIVTGWVDEADLTRLTDDQNIACLDAMAASGEVALYQGSLDTPLETVACDFADPVVTEEAEEEAAEEPAGEPEAADPEPEEEYIEDDDADDAALTAASIEEETGNTEETEANEEDTGMTMAAMLAEAGFALEETSARVLVGDTYAISAIDANGQAIDEEMLLFASSDADIAQVDESGVVTALAAGSADISVTYDGKVLTSAVNVPQEPSSIQLSAASSVIGVKETYDGLNVTMLPEGSAATLTWSSSDTDYVKVNAATGEITGVRKGSATITVKTRNGKKAKCKVTVKKAPTKVTASPDSLLLSARGMKGKVKAGVPSGTASGSITFTSSNTAVARVDDSGVVTTVGAGSAIITAAAFNGKQDTCEVTVLAAPASVAFGETSLRLGVGQTADMNASAAAADGSQTVTDFTYSVKSGDAGCVSIDAETGAVTAVKEGSAVITAASHNGVAAAKALTVTVSAAPASIALNAATGVIGVKESYAGLSYTLTPPAGANACAAEVTWTSNKPKVARVDAKTGGITGLKEGGVNITAKTHNGKTAKCRVTVKKAPSKVTLTPETGKISVGMTLQLKKKLSSGSASGRIAYTTSNAKVASVNEKGLVTAVGRGTATITVETFNGKTDTCEVTVCAAPGIVTMGASAMSLGVGQKSSVSAIATAADGSETVTTLTYAVDPQSPNPGCITIDPDTGAIKAVSKGTANVYAHAHNGVKAWFPCTVTVLAAPAAVKLNVTSVTIGVKQTWSALSATLTPAAGETACAGSVTWSSDDKSVATVNAQTGEVTGKGTGTAVITAKAYNGVKATCKVKVKKAPTKVTLSPDALKLSAGGMAFSLKAALPSGTAGEIRYTSSNNSVAAVDGTGRITTVNPGSAVITAETYNGHQATCSLTVTAKPAHAAFSDTSVSISTEATYTPEVVVLAADGSASMADLKFSIDAQSPTPDCITINDTTGEISGISKGQAIVNVVTHNGVKAEKACTVTVVPAPTGVKLSATTAKLGVGQEYPITGTVTGPEGCDTRLTWTSNNQKVATVDENGVVTAVATGTATITAMTGNRKKATCAVTVKKAPTSVSISPATGKLNVGQSGQYKVTLSSGSYGSYTFTSSDEDVAIVTEKGYVTGVGGGKVTITCKTYNGKTAKATLTVKDPAAGTIPASMEKLGIASYQSSYSSSLTTADKLEYVIYVAQSQLGKPYVWGSFGPNQFDCVGFTYYCFGKIGISLKQTAYSQGYDNRFAKITDISDLKRGDLVFFNTESDGDLSDHASIYLGKGYFIHCSSAKGKVIVSSLSEAGTYYNRNFTWGRRVLG